MFITANKLYKSYGDLQVLKGVSLQISKGEIVSIVGASGAGKSTLLHLLGTLDKADSGDISINDTKIESLKGDHLAAFRNKHLGYIFQSYKLLPEFTAIENVELPALIAGESSESVRSKASELLDYVGLLNRINHKPGTLSGGEQQRVAIARALMNSPDLILADEPSGNLDSANATKLHELFFDLRKKLNQTFIIVTHNKELAAMADRKLQMNDGIIL